MAKNYEMEEKMRPKFYYTVLHCPFCGTKLDSVNERGYTFLECPNQECISICSMFGMEPIWYPRIDGNTAIGLTLRAYAGADLRLFFEGLGNIYTSSI